MKPGHRCPFCKNRISADALTCQRCGRDQPEHPADVDGEQELMEMLVGALDRAKQIARASSIEASRGIRGRLVRY